MVRRDLDRLTALKLNPQETIRALAERRLGHLPTMRRADPDRSARLS